MKNQRQAALLRLIEDGSVTSQTSAVKALEVLGFGATQATVSRDFEELGAIRMRVGDTVRYAFAESEKNSAFGMSLPQVLRELVLERAASGSLAVLRTPPGHAAVVAAAIDRAHVAGIIGTIAGDDTVFVCGDAKRGGLGVIELFERMETSK